MIGLDTNVLVRYIVQDDPKQSAKASKFIETECTTTNPGFIGIVTLIELVWVSESCYNASKVEIISIVRHVLSTRQFIVQDSDIAWKALGLFEAGQADFADYLVERIANSKGCEFTVTFDKKAASAGMKLLN